LPGGGPLQEGRRRRPAREADREARPARAPVPGQGAGLALAARPHDGGDGARAGGARPRRGRAREAPRRQPPQPGVPRGRDHRKGGGAGGGGREEESLMAVEGRKNLRQFQCADSLWNTVRRMATEQDKGIDELISDALVAYAQLAGYQSGVTTEDSP